MLSFKPSFKRLSNADLLLLILGVAGFIFWIRTYPRQHPDAAVPFPKPKSEILHQAKSFLTYLGYDIEQLHFQIKYRKNVDLWRQLQRILGRAETLEQFSKSSVKQLPVYYWEIDVCRSTQNTSTEVNTESFTDRCPFRLHVSPEGYVFRFANKLGENVVLKQRNNAQNRYFDFPRLVTGRALTSTAVTTKDLNAITIRATLESGEKYLRKLPFFQKSTFLVDSISIRNNQVKIHFKNTNSFWGIKHNVWLRLNTDFVMTNLQTSFTPDRKINPIFLSKDAYYLRLSFWGLGLLIFATIFFRRMQNKAVDFNTAIRDGSWAGFFLTLYLGNLLFVDIFDISNNNDWVALLLTVLLGGCGGALLIFFVSGATDALARGYLPQKIISLNIVRRFHVRNKPVGKALIRGLLGVGCVLGFIALALALKPSLEVHVTRLIPPDFPHVYLLQPFIGLGSLAVFCIFLFFCIVYLGFGAWLYQWKGAWAYVIGTGILYVFFSIHPFFIHPFIDHFWVNCAVGTFLGLLIMRFDVFTAGVTQVVYMLCLQLSVGYFQPQMSEHFDWGLLMLTCGGLVILGFYGLIFGEERDAIEIYQPQYLKILAQEQRLQQDLEIASNIQRSFLPHKMPELAGAQIFARAETALQVGGDYYDFIDLENQRLGIMIGDVSGKGIAAALFVTFTKGLVQTLARKMDTPKQVLQRLNHLFGLNATAGTFFTAIYGILDMQQRTFTFSRAGHNPVLLKRQNAQETLALLPNGIAVGLAKSSVFDAHLQEKTVQLEQGDILVLYTDGLSEAMDKSRTQLSNQKIANFVSQNADYDAETICHNLLAERRLFSGREIPEDDCAVIVIKIT